MNPVLLPAGIFTDPRLKATDIHVAGLIAVAIAAGRPAISFEELAGMARLARRSVIRAAKNCEACGWLSRQARLDDETGSFGANHWQILWPAVEGRS